MLSDSGFVAEKWGMPQFSKEEIDAIVTSLGIATEDIPKSLRKSPNLLFYLEAILGRWSTRQLSMYAKDHFKESFSPEIFRRFALRISESHKISKTFVQSTFQGMDVPVIGYVELQNAVALMRAMVTKLVDLQMSMGGLVLGQTLDAIKAYCQMCKDLAEIQITIGVLTGKNNNPVTKADDERETDLKVKKVMMSLTDEQKRQFGFFNESSHLECFGADLDRIHVIEYVDVQVVQAA